jgi:signal transduction histidine kinase
VAVRAAARGIEIDVRYPPEPLTIEADRPILFSMLKNLVDNAAKFSPDGAVVRVHAERSADGLSITVTDLGPGIPPDKQDRIFEKFYRVQSAGQPGVEGSGLGLVIARQAARAHGGDISVASRPGAGSTFTVRLPAALVVPAVAAALEPLPA